MKVLPLYSKQLRDKTVCSINNKNSFHEASVVYILVRLCPGEYPHATSGLDHLAW